MCVVVGPACGLGVGGGLVRRGVPVLFIGSLRLRHTGLMRHVRAGGCRASGFVGGVVSGAGGCRLGVVGDGLLADVHGLEVSLGLPQPRTPTGARVRTPTRARVRTPTGARAWTPTGARAWTPTGARAWTPTRARARTPTRARARVRARRWCRWRCRLRCSYVLHDLGPCSTTLVCVARPRGWSCNTHQGRGEAPGPCRSTGVVRCRRPLRSTGQRHALISTGQKRALMPTPRPKVPRSRRQPAYPVPGGVVAVVWSLRARMLTVCQDTPALPPHGSGS